MVAMEWLRPGLWREGVVGYDGGIDMIPRRDDGEIPGWHDIGSGRRCIAGAGSGWRWRLCVNM